MTLKIKLFKAIRPVY